ncbi:MAG: hypothetical protein ABJM06_03635 [Gilvibacter sp.]
MKNLLLILFFMSAVAFAQQQGNQEVTNSAIFGSSSNSLGLFQSDESTVLYNSNDISKIQGVASIRDFDNWQSSGEVTDGTVYLFDEWAAKGYVIAGDKRFVFPKMNYNVSQGAVVSKFTKDSIFNIGLSGYDMILLNNKVFKSIYNPARGGNVMYQVIYEGPDYSLVKEFSLEVKESDPNPMVNRSRRKIIKKEHYYKMEGAKFTKFKPSKKSVTKIAGDKADAVVAYAKAARLSFKKDEDLVKILNHLYGQVQ